MFIALLFSSRSATSKGSESTGALQNAVQFTVRPDFGMTVKHRRRLGVKS